MTDEQPEPQDFSTFETQATEQPDKADAGEEKKPAAADDTLELGGGEEAPKADEGKEKTRSRPWQTRVDILTARLREAERENAELRTAKSAKIPDEADDPPPDPFAKNPDGTDKYEFGEADPKFLRDDAAQAARQAIREDRDARAKTEAENAGKAEIAGKLQEGMTNIEKAGAEKYEDFEEKLEAAVEARGGEPLPPLLGIGIAVSPAGADIAYKLATDEAAADKIERLARTNPQAAAIAFGELEGEFLSDDSDSDLNPADPLDMARMLGREKARRKGGAKADARNITRAPTPPESRARGNGGRFEAGADTTDFASFERMANRK